MTVKEPPPDFYKTLEVPRDASPEQVKKAYRKKAKQSHPDTGADGQEFRQIARAYETLGDPEKREHYDQTGDEKPIVNEVEAVIASSLVEAFMREDPITFILEKLEADRDEIQMRIAMARGNLRQVSKNLEKFKKQNKKSRNTTALGFISEALQSQIDGTEQMIQANEKKAQLCTDCMTYLNDLYRSPQRGR